MLLELYNMIRKASQYNRRYIRFPSLKFQRCPFRSLKLVRHFQVSVGYILSPGARITYAFPYKADCSWRRQQRHRLSKLQSRRLLRLRGFGVSIFAYGPSLRSRAKLLALF